MLYAGLLATTVFTKAQLGIFKRRRTYRENGVCYPPGLRSISKDNERCTEITHTCAQYRGSDLTSTTATIKGPSTNQMRLIYIGLTNQVRTKPVRGSGTQI
jgi:hypothetical protein